MNTVMTDMSKIEASWVHLEDANLSICCFYRSQNFCPVDTFIDYMTECMLQLQGKSVVWIGDVNINQNSLNCTDYKKLDITMKSFGMIQTVSGITRIGDTKGRITQSTIDVVITNCYSKFTECKVLDDCIGDHQVIKCSFDVKVKKAKKFKKIHIRDQSTNNLKALRQYLGQGSDYSSLMNCTDIEAIVGELNYHVETAYDHFCPIKQIKTHSNYLIRPTPEILAEIKKKRDLNRRHKRSIKTFNKFKCKCSVRVTCSCRKQFLKKKCDDNKEAYRKQKNLVTKLATKHKRQEIVNDLTKKSLTNDLKGIWKTIKHTANLPSKKNTNTGTGQPLNVHAANLHFSTVGILTQNSITTTSTDREEFRSYMPPSAGIKFEQFDEVTALQIQDYISSIPSDKSINDKIPLKVYKYVIPELIPLVTHIVNLSLKTGVMPNACKIASVRPIFKTGDHNEPTNYRPISILPLLGKCIEYFVHIQLSSYVEENNIIGNRQYGFRKNHSTTFLMLDLFDKIFKSKESGKKSAIVYLDVKKAFDTVNHDILIKKLKHYGVDGFVIKWFESFLDNRQQSTRVGNINSENLLVKAGVPQGSILGPILFSIYINDLSHCCQLSTPYLFADDSALYFDSTKRNDHDDIRKEMGSIGKWFKINLLCLNMSKSSFMIFDRKDDLETITFSVEQDQYAITETKTQKYLGLLVDSQLNFHDHIDHVKSKIAKRIGALYRSKKFLPLKYRKMFVNALMLPQFDYLDIIWSRTSKYQLNSLDVVYKKVAKIALDMDRREASTTVYETMKWLPLHLRRQLHLTTYMYKVMNDLAPRELINLFNYVSGGTRDSEKCNLYTPKSRSHKSFSYLGVKCWNNTPESIRTSHTVESMITSLKSAFMSEIINNTEYKVNNSYDYFYRIETNIVNTARGLE